MPENATGTGAALNASVLTVSNVGGEAADGSVFATADLALRLAAAERKLAKARDHVSAAEQEIAAIVAEQKGHA